MGCCKSLPDNRISPLPSPISEETIEFEQILSNIPVHCREEIMDLPSRQHFINVYKHHLNAINFFQLKQFELAILSEYNAIHNIVCLLPNQKDHFIFAQMHKILSLCYWEINNIKLAITEAQIALNIMLKHIPTDYTEISFQYFRVAFFCLQGQEWRDAEQYLIKTIETARFSNALQEDYIEKMEELLSLARQNINDVTPLRVTVRQMLQNPGEDEGDFLRRATAEMIAQNAANGTLKIDKTEFERLPNKQTESQINDEILNEVLKFLGKYLNEDEFLCKFGTKFGSMEFIAAQFKRNHMKTSLLSPAIIEAALTIIINRLNDVNYDNDQRYRIVKQSPFTISYTNDDEYYTKGVRVFQVKAKNQFKAQ